MATRDLANNISVANSILPAVNASTQTGSSVDTKGYESVTALVNVGAVAGAGNVTVKLQDSDDNSTWADVTAGNLIGSFPAALVQNTILKVGYKGAKRYIRAVGTLNSGTSVAYGVAIVESHPNVRPAA